MLTNQRFTEFDRELFGMDPGVPDALTVTLRDLGPVCVIQCAGRITPNNEHRLREVMRSQSSDRELVLDLARIEAIDSIGIGALVTLRGWAMTLGIGFKLMNLRPAVEKLMRATNLIGTFHLCTVRETLAIWCRAMRCPKASAATIAV